MKITVTEQEVAEVMIITGMDYLQARRHVQSRKLLHVKQLLSPNPFPLG
jgi:hypothetical protein